MACSYYIFERNNSKMPCLKNDEGFWACILQCNINNLDFQNTAALWTNEELLNSDNLNLFGVNAKYQGFIDLPISKYMAIMNGVADKAEFKDEYKGKTMLDWQSISWTASEVLSSYLTEWKTRSYRELANLGGYQPATMECLEPFIVSPLFIGNSGYRSSKCRIGYTLDDINTISYANPDSSIGLGLTHNYYPNNVPCGYANWEYGRQFFPISFWVYLGANLDELHLLGRLFYPFKNIKEVL